MGKIDYYGLGIDPSIRPLLSLQNTEYPHHSRACQAYSQWMKDYDEQEIAAFFKVSVEEACADLEHIRALLPVELIALHVRERDELYNAKEKWQKVHDELANDLSLPIDELIAQGKNPADVLRRYREAVDWEAPSDTPSDLDELDSNISRNAKERQITEDPNKINDLRRQSNPFDGSFDNLDLEAANKLIEELRRADQLSSKKAVTHSHQPHESDPTPIQQNGSHENDPNQKLRGIKTDGTDRRVTVRLDPDTYDKLQQYIHDTGIGLSSTIRTALAQFLEGDSSSADSTPTSMPAEALKLIGRYQVWGSDLKEKLRENFLELVAMAYVTEKRWPRAMWVKELCNALIPIYRILEGVNVRQD